MIITIKTKHYGILAHHAALLGMDPKKVVRSKVYGTRTLSCVVDGSAVYLAQTSAEFVEGTVKLLWPYGNNVIEAWATSAHTLSISAEDVDGESMGRLNYWTLDERGVYVRQYEQRRARKLLRTVFDEGWDVALEARKRGIKMKRYELDLEWS